jgi:hypothetical protein
MRRVVLVSAGAGFSRGRQRQQCQLQRCWHVLACSCWTAGRGVQGWAQQFIISGIESSPLMLNSFCWSSMRLLDLETSGHV